MSGSGRSAALRLIEQLLLLGGPGVDLVEASERDWTSATFAGQRHVITLSATAASIDAPPPAWLVAVPEHGFELSGAFVAEAVATSAAAVEDAKGHVTRLCTVELLTVRDDVA